MQYMKESMLCSAGYDALISYEDIEQKQRDYALTHREINKTLSLYLVFIFRVEELTDCLLHMRVSVPRG